jgi:hypothetical protein
MAGSIQSNYMKSKPLRKLTMMMMVTKMMMQYKASATILDSMSVNDKVAT